MSLDGLNAAIAGSAETGRVNDGMGNGRSAGRALAALAGPFVRPALRGRSSLRIERADQGARAGAVVAVAAAVAVARPSASAAVADKVAAVMERETMDLPGGSR